MRFSPEVTRKSRNIRPESRNIKPESRNIRPESRNITRKSRNIRPESRNIRPESRNIRPETHRTMPQRYVISRFAFVSWSDGTMHITSPVTGKTFTTGDASLLHTLAAFATPRALDADATNAAEWIAAGILVDADAPEPAALQHWDRDALALHAGSRDPNWRKTPGHATAAIAPRRRKESIALARGGANAPRVTSDLAALLDARRSRRNWAPAPIAFAAFSDLLWLSARNRENGHRPYPSGGAAYSLELYPILGFDAVDTLGAGVYRYLPEAHALELMSPFDADFLPFLAAAGRAMGTPPPPASLVLTSRYARQSEEYGRLAYSLILKEVGCLFQTLYLAAESLGLAACALGGGTPRGLLAGLCDTTELEEPVVGEFALGYRSPVAV
jgi:SagB-type dehydrogenase family enzyme